MSSWQEMSQRELATHALDRHSPRLGGSDDETARGRCGHVVCGVSKSRWARLCVHGDGRVHGPSRHLTPTSIAVTTTRKGTCKMVGSPFHVAKRSFSPCHFHPRCLEMRNRRENRLRRSGHSATGAGEQRFESETPSAAATLALRPWRVTHRPPAWAGQLWPAGRIAARHGTASTTTASGHGHAVTLCDYDGAMQVVGDEPSHVRERRPGATGGKGFEGECSIPSPDPNVRTLGRLALAT